MVNATGSEQADVLVEDGIIKQVGPDIDVPEGTRIIDATDKLVMPGTFKNCCFCKKPREERQELKTYNKTIKKEHWTKKSFIYQNVT